MNARWSPAIPALAVVVGLLLGTSLVLLSRSRPEHPSSRRPHQRSEDQQGTLMGLVDPEFPLGADIPRTTLDEAINASPIPVLRSQTAAVSDQSISGVWVRQYEPVEIFLRYENGVQVALRRPEFVDGFVTFYKGEIRDGYPGELIDVSGIPVFVVPSGETYIEADLVIADLFVQVVAAEKQLTADEMTTLVNSILESASVQ
jgi:hypothetical protein